MDLLAATSTVAVSSYALLSTVYKSVQALYATPTEAPSPPPGLRQTAAGLPSVDVIVPCFNEDPQILSACLQSIANQDYAGKLQVFVVDDGSANRDAVGAVQRIYADDPRFSFILLRQNAGKRKAQIAAIRRSSGDLVLNVDSDTVIDADVITKLASKMSDPEIGASMGQLTASNRNDTWLTRLIDMEYWLACNEERAAQARFGAVMCCCGPCAMYRRSALVLLLDQYEAQFFRGKPSDFGEDRHLTILMLKAGFRTEYVPDAIAATVVPDRLAPYLRQQLRWARSTFRDTWLAMRLLPGLDSYLTLDVIGQRSRPPASCCVVPDRARADRCHGYNAMVDRADDRIDDHDSMQRGSVSRSRYSISRLFAAYADQYPSLASRESVRPVYLEQQRLAVA